jgi:Lon protease-like protein
MPKVELTIPDEAPVMVLPNTLAFPQTLTPLYIFEPRYRAMLQWVLERDRVFCIALQKPEFGKTPSPKDCFHTAGLGLVRACVGRSDGTSHLMLQGLARVRLTDFVQTKPFFLSRIEVLPSAMHNDKDPLLYAEETAKYANEVRDLCRECAKRGADLPEGVEPFLAHLSDPELLADTVAHAFLRDPLRRQHLMEETDVLRRLRGLAMHLRAELKV